MSRLFITGDTHRNADIAKLFSENFAKQSELSKDDYLIVLGDFGAIWNGDSEMTEEEIALSDLNPPTDKEMIDFYNSRPWTTLFIDGNHENHPAIAKYPVEEWCGGKIHRISDSIFHLMRGQVFEIEGIKFFTMGGATSVDKWCRTEGVGWWPEEVPSREEMDEAIANLERYDFTVDYILTHDCPEGVYNIGNSENGDPVRRFLKNLETILPLKYKQWYFGHHHIDKHIGDKHTAVYDNIIELHTEKESCKKQANEITQYL